MKYEIIPFQEEYQQQIVELILSIQQIEFKVPITIKDQPDLLDVPFFYVKGNGNFWLALNDKKVVGTIALIDIGSNQVALRKMFVHSSHRGKIKGVAQLLFSALREWSEKRDINEILLGTIDTMHAAHRFYEKNGFEVVTKSLLPKNFPIMKVDNTFYRYKVIHEIYHITPSSWWEKFTQKDYYESETLSQEGFIHCSKRQQVEAVLERYYANAKQLLLLHINTALLKPKLLYEEATLGELYPHVYGRINKEAIIKVEPLHIL